MKSGDLVIRPARAADRGTLLGFMIELQEYERRLHANRAAGAVMADGHLHYLERMVAAHDGLIAVAERAEGLIGFMVAFVECGDEGDLHLRASERCHGLVSDLYVTAEARGAGVGAALLAAAECHFSRHGLIALRICSMAANTAALRAYRRAGYVDYELVLEKRLPPADASR